MNLLFLISSLDRGGAETHLVSLATDLAKRGHSVRVLSYGGALTEPLALSGVVHQTLPLHSRSPFALLYSYRAIKKLLSSLKKHKCFAKKGQNEHTKPTFTP